MQHNIILQVLAVAVDHVVRRPSHVVRVYRMTKDICHPVHSIPATWVGSMHHVSDEVS